MEHVGYGWNVEIYDEDYPEGGITHDILQLTWLSYHPPGITIIEMPIKVDEEKKVVEFIKKRGSKRLWINELNEKDAKIKEYEEELNIAEQKITELSLRPDGPGYREAKEHFESMI